MSGITIEKAATPLAETGEGAVWDAETGLLYWVDIPPGMLYSLDPSSGEERSWAMGEPIGCLALRAGGGAIVALQSGFYAFDFETGEKTPIVDPEAHLPENRFNDGATDRQGRIWAGTMTMARPQTAAGTFYRLDPDLSCTPWLGGIYTTNGLAFSPDGRTMYCSDSFPEVRTIWSMDYDTDTCTPGERRPFFDTRQVAGRPDGGTVDADGCYWMAGVSGWQLVRITPKGEIDRIVELPIERPSKPMFGGRNLDTLFVTSISHSLTPGTKQPLAGALLAITGLGVTGVPEVRFAG